LKQYQHLIGNVDNNTDVTAPNGNTRDIMNTVLFADGKAGAYCAALAQALKGADQVQTCYNIWKFWKENVKYVEDPDGIQVIKSPAILYHLGEGDCKSYSVAVAACLKQLGIPYAYRFITQETNNPFHHVYVVAYTDKGTVLIDCVIDLFNKENPYARKKDVPGAHTTPQPKRASIGRASRGVHYLPNSIGATQAELSNNSWIAIDADFKARYQQIKQACKAAGFADIDNEYPSAILRRNKFKKAWGDNFDGFLQSANTLLYLYWDNTQAQMPTNPMPPDNVSIFVKTGPGSHFKDALTEMGIRSATFRTLAALACYNTYGITLEHMLDRCYNMVNYGQPWKPAQGVPYYNFKTGVFVNQGTTPESLETALKILMCLPAAGGVTRPYGQPYIAAGGWYIQNGATDAVFAEYKKNYVWSDYEKGRISLLTADAFAPCYAAYQQWISGNMPALPAAAVYNGKSQKIGVGKIKPAVGDPLGVTAIVAIVVAVLGVVSTIIKLVADIVGKSTTPIPQRFLPCPPPDFQMEYQTVDGCYIGRAPAECGAQKAKYCPDGTFVCINDADLARPENQAGAPQGGFGAGGNTWLLVGIAAVLLFFGLSGGSKSKS
jgi:predicted transglutaminase-like cysteine proteinase